MNIDQPYLKNLVNVIGNENIKIDINNEEDLRKLKELGLFSNVNVTIKLNDLQKIYELQRNEKYHITLRIDNITQLSKKKLEKLEKNYHIDRIQISQEFEDVKGRNLSNVISEECCNLRETYRKDVYIKIVKQINELTKKIRKNTTEAEKFCSIYKLLGELIEYPYNHYEECELLNKKEYLEYSEDHNLTGCLFDRQGACEGIAKTLKQMLARVSIESKQIMGDINGNPHMWNQVKIDGKWYNCDLTQDLSRITNGKSPKYCLLSDEDFKEYITDTPVKEDCYETYDQQELEKYFTKNKQLTKQGFFTKFKKVIYKLMNGSSNRNSISNNKNENENENKNKENNNKQQYDDSKNLWRVEEKELLNDKETTNNKKKINEENIDR